MLGWNRIAYSQQAPAGAIPPPETLQFKQAVPDFWYLVQVPGVGAIADYHQNPWYQGPYQGGFSPQSKLLQKVFYSGPPLDDRAYDLPLTTGYNPNNPGECP